MKLSLVLLSVMVMMMTRREAKGDPNTFLIETADDKNQGIFFNLNKL